MQRFAERLGGFPKNVCAMTTVTGRSTRSRIDALRGVDARIRGLSIEPLWESLGTDLDLTGIDWVIVGGESSGKRKHQRQFDLAWLRELRDQCHTQGVAFFVKQLGGRPVEKGRTIAFSSKDAKHSDWEKWPSDLRIREFPRAFHEYTPLGS